MPTATLPENVRDTSATRDVPVSALMLTCGDFVFAESGPDAQTFPFTMKARSGGVINHWYWGRIVHDMAGMQLRKPTCPIDYCHHETEVIGVGEKFAAGNDGLNVSGQLVALAADPSDRAYEVATKAKNRIPFEASIDWRGPGILIEEVGEGVSVEVNGQTFEGPLTVVRKWPLRAIAVCPYGADSNTSTQFSDEQHGKDMISVCLFSAQSERHAVTKSTQTATDSTPAGNAPAGSQQHSQTPAGQVSLETMQQFTTQFGAAKANEYLLAGLTFVQAEQKFQAERIAALEAENKQLKESAGNAAAAAAAASTHTQQLADKLLGEQTPVQTAPTGGSGKRSFADMVRIHRNHVG